MGVDTGRIAARDVFEYGISLIVNSIRYSGDIEDILDELIGHAADPVQRNFALAKKGAFPGKFFTSGASVLLIFASPF